MRTFGWVWGRLVVRMMRILRVSGVRGEFGEYGGRLRPPSTEAAETRTRVWTVGWAICPPCPHRGPGIDGGLPVGRRNGGQIAHPTAGWVDGDECVPCGSLYSRFHQKCRATVSKSRLVIWIPTISVSSDVGFTSFSPVAFYRGNRVGVNGKFFYALLILPG